MQSSAYIKPYGDCVPPVPNHVQAHSVCDSIPRLEVRQYFHLLKDKTHAENEDAQGCRKAVPSNRDRQADASAHQAGSFYDQEDPWVSPPAVQRSNSPSWKAHRCRPSAAIWCNLLNSSSGGTPPNSPGAELINAWETGPNCGARTPRPKG